MRCINVRYLLTYLLMYRLQGRLMPPGGGGVPHNPIAGDANDIAEELLIQQK